MLQDIRSSSSPFGGITVVFGGDFQQTLPVIVHGSRADVLNATIQSSVIWTNVNVLHLHKNMRIDRNTVGSDSFAEWLLEVGHGQTCSGQTVTPPVPLPTHMLCDSEDDLIQKVYGPSLNCRTIPPPDYFRDRAILAACNHDIRTLNTTIPNLLPGSERSYLSADTYTIESSSLRQNQDVPIEFLHSLNASGLPVAELRLKPGCPILLLRNIDTKRGLCNGTRGTIINMSDRLLEIRLLTGDHAGQTALIPRITLSPSLTNLDFALKLNRRQFPVQLGLAITINKAQGQSLRHVGVDLRKQVFAHGQLYVALSRATTAEHLAILLPTESQIKTARNVVYNEILLH